MTPLHTAHIIRTGAIHRAIRQILGHRPAVSRTIRETGSSLAQIIERNWQRTKFLTPWFILTLLCVTNTATAIVCVGTPKTLSTPY